MAYDRWHLGRRIAPPAFVLFGAVLVVALAALIPTIGFNRGVMAAFDAAAIAFFAKSVPVLSRHAEDIRRTAPDNDANRTLLLAVTSLVTLAILAAIFGALSGHSSAWSIVLVVATLALAWLFSNSVYAFHYAHLFYSDGDGGKPASGLRFPGTDAPEYWEFLYFSFTLGMTFQTSDVAVESTAMRRIVIGQSLAAFVFNLGVIAFTINVLGGGH